MNEIRKRSKLKEKTAWQILAIQWKCERVCDRACEPFLFSFCNFHWNVCARVDLWRSFVFILHLLSASLTHTRSPWIKWIKWNILCFYRASSTTTTANAVHNDRSRRYFVSFIFPANFFIRWSSSSLLPTSTHSQTLTANTGNQLTSLESVFSGEGNFIKNEVSSRAVDLVREGNVKCNDNIIYDGSFTQKGNQFSCSEHHTHTHSRKDVMTKDSIHTRTMWMIAATNEDGTATEEKAWFRFIEIENEIPDFILSSLKSMNVCVGVVCLVWQRIYRRVWANLECIISFDSFSFLVRRFSANMRYECAVSIGPERFAHSIACVQKRYTRTPIANFLCGPVLLVLSRYSVYSDSIDFQIFIIINSHVKTRAQLMRLGFACMRQRRPQTRPHIDKLITIALSPL